MPVVPISRSARGPSLRDAPAEPFALMALAQMDAEGRFANAEETPADERTSEVPNDR